MVHRPRLLFLDEPTTGLDPQSRSALWEEVWRLRDEGTSIFLTTHYMDEADALCDRLAIMDHGKIVAVGAPEALKREVSGDVVTLDLQAHNGAFRRARELLRAQPFVRELGEEVGEGLRLYVERGEEALPAILRLLDAAGLRTRAVSLSRPTLDDVFLRETGQQLKDPVEKDEEVLQ